MFKRFFGTNLTNVLTLLTADGNSTLNCHITNTGVMPCSVYVSLIGGPTLDYHNDASWLIFNRQLGANETLELRGLVIADNCSLAAMISGSVGSKAVAVGYGHQNL